MGKARNGGDQISPTSTDRAKRGSKKACSSMFKVDLWRSSSLRPTSTTISC
jgi:hypothetical protein